MANGRSTVAMVREKLEDHIRVTNERFGKRDTAHADHETRIRWAEKQLNVARGYFGGGFFLLAALKNIKVQNNRTISDKWAFPAWLQKHVHIKSNSRTKRYSFKGKEPTESFFSQHAQKKSASPNQMLVAVPPGQLLIRAFNRRA